MTNHPAFQAVKHAGDIASVSLIVGTIASWLPSIATLLSVLWFLIRLYDRFKYGPAAKRKGPDED